ncbi:GNAT family N-acetyltransferase [Mesorhizobium sp. LHD-90]|uniref:GNAT family N-acetyltransferase n=1 Tax=Mesorhizobium sp. LHD-90 TaxID=3071414 RepID=UPI0027E00792|nr:GNAT family N-acetyltransferase [Mesorhizobium sp. LHD-90]MDQ6436271.1 GNAT family N-acetyltransferase [Mesorhizobium sp. LHD-90]
MDVDLREPGTASPAEIFAGLFRAHPTDRLIRNLATEVSTLTVGRYVLPVTVNDGTTLTCYVCCPSAAYVDYAREELRTLSNPALRQTMAALVTLSAPLVRATNFDRQIQPNNWLLATNIQPTLTASEIADATHSLLRRWPDRAIVWRSLNEISDRLALEAFRRAGYKLYPARQIYLFDCRTDAPRRRRDEKRDRILLGQADYRVEGPDGIRPEDFERIEELYGLLYLQKYTPLNPQYSARFLSAMHETGLLRVFGLRNRQGRLDGVITFFDQRDVMTAPVVGYDTSITPEVGLYRRLMAIGLRRARENRRLFNMSAGAAGFKRNRGGMPAIEYAAVYSSHLPWRNRAAAGIIRGVLNGVGVPVMRKLKL